MNIRFDEKVAIITGSSSGIGKAAAVEFAKAGAKVVVHYNTNKKGAEEVMEAIAEEGGQAIAVGGDLTSEEMVDNLISRTISTFGAIDILVNNAGTLVERKQVSDMSRELWDRVMAVNMTSTFLCTHAAIPHLKKQQAGRIINISSVAARNGGGLGAAHYSAAKAAAIAFTKNLAKEMAPFNIWSTPWLLVSLPLPITTSILLTK